MVTLSVLIVTLIVGHVIPLATALITKCNAAAWVKQVTTGILSAVAGMLTTATQADGTAVLSKESLALALVAFLASQAAYVGFYKPHAANQKLAPGVGIGAANS